MVTGTDAVQVGIVLVVAATIAYVWHLEGRGQWRAFLEKRFLYGVPWGTMVTVIGVIAFYLLAQSGLHHWSSPVVHPFRSWSYTYPLGWLAAGFAHANPNHLIGNMTATIILGPIVEYAWGHYPPGKGPSEQTRSGSAFAYPPPGEVTAADVETTDSAAGAESHPLVTNPWSRALLVFPVAMIVLSITTSFFALGWSLGFSGTVFVLLGFALIRYPLTTVVSMVVLSAVSIIIAALRQPVLVATADPGGPSPPSWAGINIQAHFLGFLLGVLLALALFSYRDELPPLDRIAFGTVIIVLVRNLWAFALGSDGVYRQYRGIGIIFTLMIALLIIAIFATKDTPLPSVSDSVPLVPKYKTLSLLWLGAIGMLALLYLAADGFSVTAIAVAVVSFLIFGFPAIPAILPDRVVSTPFTQRELLVGGLIFVTIIVALPSVAANLPGMDDDPVPGEGAVEIEDYTITYAEDAPHGRIDSNSSGVIVVSEQREMWSSVVNKNQLAHRGKETVVVGGIGWRDTVDANRTGWDVAGNDSAYVVDLEYEGDRTRAFTSEPVEAQSRISNQTIRIVPTENMFRLNVSRDDTPVGDVAIPPVNQTTTLDQLRLSTELKDDTKSVFAAQDGTRVLIAEAETFD